MKDKPDVNFNDWLKTDEGKDCANFTNLTGEKYLLHRLWYAYLAGQESMQSSIEKLIKENAELQRRRPLK